MSARPLSERQARACEDADTSRCRCRCGGRFHGARRGAVDQLPAADPHRPAEPRAVREAKRHLDQQLAGLDAFHAAARRHGFLR